MTRESKSPPAKTGRKTKPRYKMPPLPGEASLPAVTGQVAPTAPMAGFDQFAAQDYAVAVPNSGKNGETRYLTVSPLRAIMAEQEGQDEHVVTERTRQGVLYAAGLGMERRVIARILGIALDDLVALYGNELETAVHLMMSDVQTNLYNIARDPSHSQAVRAGMYMLGRLGNELYKDRQRGEALTVNPQTRTIDPSLLDDDQRQALRDILTSALRLAAPRAEDAGEVIDAEYSESSEEDVL